MPHGYSPIDLEYEILYNPGFVPLRRGMVSVKTVLDSTGRRHLMRNHTTGSYYHLDSNSSVIWELIDGTRNVPQILAEAGAKKVGEIEAYGILLFFAESGALSSTVEQKRRRRMRIVSSFRVEIPIIHRSQDFLKGIHRVLSPLLRSPLTWIALGFIVINGILFAGPFTAIFGDPRNFQIAGSTVLGLFFYQMIILTPVIAVHEISHGLALVHYGGKPGEMGFGLLYFGLMFYTDATDSWGLKRNQRVMVMLAGVLSTMLIGAVLVTIYFLRLLPAKSFIEQVVLMTAFWCFYNALWNMAPFFETDGYYTLTDLLNMPDLKSQSFAYLARHLKRIFRRPVEMVEDAKVRKRLFIGYLILSAGFLVYIVFTTLRLAFYMAEDSVSRLAGIIFSQSTPRDVLVALIAVFYFTLYLSGYAVLAATAARKAAVRTLKFETIHDRKLSVFAHLPVGLPESISKSLDAKMRHLCRKHASDSSVTHMGPIHVAMLRMGSTKLAIQQIRKHLRNAEIAFASMYQKFLLKHRGAIQASVGIYSRRKRVLPGLLLRMAGEMSSGGRGEAKRTARQIILQRQRDVLYLLNSTFSTVWTIEIPPAQQQEFEGALMPASLAEDLSITDLYGEVEDFKKRIIYGYDSLRIISLEAKDMLGLTLTNPEKYHVVQSFEPVKGRLLFVGRTERVEEEIPKLAPVFLSQVWSGYTDNLFSETNLALSALGDIPTPSSEDMGKLRDGEVTALKKNLIALLSTEAYVSELVKGFQGQLQVINSNLKKTSSGFRKLDTPGLELLESFFSINRENLESLQDRIKDLHILTGNLFGNVTRIAEVVNKAYEGREAAFVKRTHKILTFYPIFLTLSILIAILAALNPPGGVLPTIVTALMIQILYGIIYALNQRAFTRVQPYRSPIFDKLEIPLFAFAQALFNLVSVADLIQPGEVIGQELSISKRPVLARTEQRDVKKERRSGLSRESHSTPTH